MKALCTCSKTGLFFVIMLLLSAGGFCGVIKVPADSATIQGAIDMAADGDVIIVAEGKYRENIHFHGKNIILRSTNPLNERTVWATNINGDIDNDGVGDGPVVTF
ncbi:MAG TPA: hypothetical protein P5245_08425, partial [Candidatus Sumerlaeia bacterium]|nr:hypothetical protein [Candidatus Sumerlaeia bacterium]